MEDASMTRLQKRYAELESNATAQPAVDLKFLKQIVGVAIAGLFEHYKEDVARVFDAATLQDVADETMHLGDQRVEDIYKRAWDMLATLPAAPVPLTDGVTIPLAVLEAAEASLGSFCSDLGWCDNDIQNMDNLSAYIARHKAANGITEKGGAA
jgi:hypothetical protein